MDKLTSTHLLNMKKLLFVLLFCPVLTFACRCDRIDNFLFNYDQAEQVFLVEVKSKTEELLETKDRVPPPPPIEWCFEVDLVESFKGNQRSTMTYNLKRSSCSFNLKVGQQYLFYLNKENEFSEFTTSLCHRTIKETDKQFDSELKHLRLLKEKNATLDVRDNGLSGLHVEGKIKNGKRDGQWYFWRYEDRKRKNILTLRYKKGKLKEISYSPAKQVWMSAKFDKIRTFYENRIVTEPIL